jgi:hypothetical protein
LDKTENERQFSANFGEQICSALETMKEKNLEGNQQKAWEPFKKANL